MTITGKYERDDNFTTIFADNTIYTVARNTGDWGCVKVGERAYIGGIVTQELYDQWESECTKTGTFSLQL